LFSSGGEANDRLMTEEDDKDYERFHEGLAFFRKLDVRQAMEHIKRQNEKIFCRESAGSELAKKLLRDLAVQVNRFRQLLLLDVLAVGMRHMN
jgi:hypothetical protein